MFNKVVFEPTGGAFFYGEHAISFVASVHYWRWNDTMQVRGPLTSDFRFEAASYDELKAALAMVSALQSKGYFRL